MIATRLDTGEPGYVEVQRGVYRGGTAIYLNVYRGDKIVAVLVVTDGEAEAVIREIAGRLPAASRHMIAGEIGRV